MWTTPHSSAGQTAKKRPGPIVLDSSQLSDVPHVQRLARFSGIGCITRHKSTDTRHPCQPRLTFRQVDFFEGRCCFCGDDLPPSKVNGDHLIPTNKTDLGLDAWGNIVPACNPCNSTKHGKDWRDFIIQQAGPDAKERHQRMGEFLKKYPYKPAYDLTSTVAALYSEAGAVGMALIHEKIKRTKSSF